MSKINIIFWLENSNKKYNISLENNIELYEQIKNFFKHNDLKSLENIKYYSLFDENTKKYILNLEDLKKYKKDKKTILILKNVSTHVNELIEILTKLISNNKIEEENNNQKNKSENIENILDLFSTNYLLINIFMDEFVSNEGINLLIKLILKYNNIYREIGLKSLCELLNYEENFNYFNENDNFLKDIYTILISAQESLEKNNKNNNNNNLLNISIINNCLKIILNFFLKYNIDNKYTFSFIDIIENNSNLTKKEKYLNLINLFNIDNISIKESVLTLLFLLLSGMDDYKSKQAEIFCQFQKLGFINILKENKNINSDIFRTYLNMFSIMINSIINNYYYTIEIYKIEIKKYQKHKENLIFEKENYKKIFIKENINEFIEYKNLEKEFINNVNNNNNNIKNKNFIEQNIDTIIKEKRFLEIQNLKKKYDNLFKKNIIYKL